MAETAERPKWWHWIVAAFLFVGALGILWLLYRAVLNLNESVTAAFVTAAAAFGAVVISRYFERAKERERAQQEKRAPIYEKFMADTLRLMGATTGPAQQKRASPGNEVQKMFATFLPQALVWASPAVLRSFATFRRVGAKGEGVASMHAMEQMFLTMRKDLGLTNRDLGRGDLVRLFIADYDEFVALAAAESAKAEPKNKTSP